MEQIPQYKIIYTETAVLDIEEKADYIETQLGEAGLALSWYLHLKETILQNLTVGRQNKVPISCTKTAN